MCQTLEVKPLNCAHYALTACHLIARLPPQEGDAAVAELRGQLEAERRSRAAEVEALSTQVGGKAECGVHSLHVLLSCWCAAEVEV